MQNLLQGKTILVAGAGGLFGSHLVPEILNQGAKVIAVDIDLDSMTLRLQSIGVDVRHPNIELQVLNVTNEQAVSVFFQQNNLNIDGAVNTTYPRNKTYGAHFLM